MPTIDAIYNAYEAEGNKPYITPRIGAGEAGTECDRAIWYSFRWTTVKVFSGRMHRLFKTGHIEEARMVADLRSAGVTVDDGKIDETTGKFKQHEFTDSTGHIVCRIDGALLGLLEAPKTWHVGEFKTSNDKGFKILVKDDDVRSKPKHIAQVQLGMHFTSMTRAYYLARNKDTDALWSYRFHYDATYSIKLVARLHGIIGSQSPPPKISNDPTWFKCKFCDHHSACHRNRTPARSCRTCVHSTPIEGAAWHCRMHDMLLDRDQQREGCGAHIYIPELIHGKQVDVIEGDNGLMNVYYIMDDGSEWIDGDVGE
jgi:hypothetical protein